MYNKILDFNQNKILTSENKEEDISKEKQELVTLILDEGLCGFFGVDKNILNKIKDDNKNY